MAWHARRVHLSISAAHAHTHIQRHLRQPLVAFTHGVRPTDSTRGALFLGYGT